MISLFLVRERHGEIPVKAQQLRSPGLRPAPWRPHKTSCWLSCNGLTSRIPKAEKYLTYLSLLLFVLPQAWTKERKWPFWVCGKALTPLLPQGQVDAGTLLLERTFKIDQISDCHNVAVQVDLGDRDLTKNCQKWLTFPKSSLFFHQHWIKTNLELLSLYM